MRKKELVQNFVEDLTNLDSEQLHSKFFGEPINENAKKRAISYIDYLQKKIALSKDYKLREYKEPDIKAILNIKTYQEDIVVIQIMLESNTLYSPLIVIDGKLSSTIMPLTKVDLVTNISMPIFYYREQ